MRLDDQRESGNVEDRRGAGRLGGGLRVGGGIGGVILLLLALVFGVDPGLLLDVQQGQPPARAPVSAPGAADAQKRFVSQVLGSTEDVWRDVFRQNGARYEDPTLVLFTGAVDSGCGATSAAVGPFYCPRDHRVYLDLDFLRSMQTRLGAGTGDFARAYVIAHEVGHHVQTLLGITDRVQAARPRLSEAQNNALSVRVELQADCLAGVWAARANDAKGILERGDVEQGLATAAAIGDDRLQTRARGYAVPDSFTHGSSAQRVRWFKRGLQSGDLRRCDTLAADAL